MRFEGIPKLGLMHNRVGEIERFTPDGLPALSVTAFAKHNSTAPSFQSGPQSQYGKLSR